MFQSKKPTKATLGIALALTLALTSTLTACSQEDIPTSQKATEPMTTLTQAKDEEPKVPPVDNDGGAFSQEDLIYFVVTDRFKDSTPPGQSPHLDEDKGDPKAYHGGDFLGLASSLDYIKSLGATAIWITPVMKNGPRGYHGYWIHDFGAVDPHLGTLEDLKYLVKEAHDRNIKVVLDYVVNHTGYDSPWLKDPAKAHWFHPDKKITDWNEKEEVEQGWLYGLPDLNTENPQVVDFFTSNALWWIEETGIDGFRLDTVRHVSPDFWTQFATAIKVKYPDFFLLGEVWSEHTSVLEPYRQTGIDTMTNYPLYTALTESLTQKGNVNQLARAVAKDQGLSRPDLGGLFIDNHDNARLVSRDPENGMAYLRLGLAFVYTYPAIPLMYYGTEIAMAGGQDPDNRRDMDWAVAEKGNDTLALVRALANVRAQYSGTITWLYNDDKAMLYQVANKTPGAEEKSLLIAINTDVAPRKFSYTFDSTMENLQPLTLEGLTFDGQITKAEGSKAGETPIEVTLPAFEFAMYSYTPAP